MNRKSVNIIEEGTIEVYFYNRERKRPRKRININGEWIDLHYYNYVNHFGPVPNGYLIKFKDRNPLNCEPENLTLVIDNFKLKQTPEILIKDGSISVQHCRRATSKRPEKKYKRIRINNEWISLAKYNYEKHFGPVSETQQVTFRDGDSMNCEPENLLLIEKSTVGKKHLDLFRQSDKYIALKIAGWNKPELVSEIMKHKKLLEVKRLQLTLKKQINERQTKS